MAIWCRVHFIGSKAYTYYTFNFAVEWTDGHAAPLRMECVCVYSSVVYLQIENVLECDFLQFNILSEDLVNGVCCG